MNTKREVIKIETGKFVFVPPYSFTEDETGRFSCSGPDCFIMCLEYWDRLTDDEKLACRNYEKDMNKKYGRGKHTCKCPKEITR